MDLKLPERRRFIRATVPLRAVIKDGDRTNEIVARNISPVGLGFESDQELEETRELEMSLYLPEAETSIRLKGKVIWQSKTSLEDNAPYDVGVEIIHIEDKNKNSFLKYLCDFLYNSTYKART